MNLFKCGARSNHTLIQIDMVIDGIYFNSTVFTQLSCVNFNRIVRQIVTVCENPFNHGLIHFGISTHSFIFNSFIRVHSFIYLRRLRADSSSCNILLLPHDLSYFITIIFLSTSLTKI